MDDLKLVSDYFDSDCPERIPTEIIEELRSRVRNNSGRPMVHLLKTFINEFPQSLVEVGTALAAIYFQDKNEVRANEWMDKLIAKYPHNAGILNLKLEMLFDKDHFDAIEELIDLEKPYTEQFPKRRIVSIEEYFRYERHGIRWHLVNLDTGAAMKRARSLSEKISDQPGSAEYQMEILQVFEDYIPKDEYTPELTTLMDDLATAGDTTGLPNLIHPELSVLFTPILREQDLPKILGLLKLPGLTLGSDLYVIIHDCFDPFKYHDYETQEAGYQLMISLIIMAGINHEDLLEAWSMVLEKDEAFLDFWLGDDLPDEMFYVGFVAGADDPKLLDDLLNFKSKTYQANFSLLISLAGIAWHYPEKRMVVLEIFERRMKELMAIPFAEFNAGHRKILTEFIDQGSLLSTSRFTELYRLAVDEDRIDLHKIDTIELFKRSENQFRRRFQYPVFIESVKDKLTRLYSRNS